MVSRKSDTSRMRRSPLDAGSATAKRGSREMPEERYSILTIQEVPLISRLGVSSIWREAKNRSKVRR